MFMGLRLGLGPRAQDQRSGFWNNRQAELVRDDYGVLVQPRSDTYDFDHRAEEGNEGRQ